MHDHLTGYRRFRKGSTTMEGETRIVLLGNTGTGKSSLANTILGVQNLFTVSTVSNSETAACKSETRNIYNRTITLVDTPGVFDTNPRSSELSTELLRCIEECAPGPHAFLLVLKVDRPGIQEQAVVDFILKYFSEEALKYTTLVFTHGDQLENGVKIKEWAIDNKALSTLVQKCGGRCHVFDNKYWKNSNDPYRNNQHQVTELLKTIDETVRKNRGKCYTNEFLTMIDNEMWQFLAAALIGAGVGGVTGGMVGAWASDRWNSPTDMVHDSVDFMREVETLVRQINTTVTAARNLASAFTGARP